MRVALHNVVLEGDYQYEQELPLGLAALGAFLREKGYDTVFSRCFARDGQQAFAKAAAVTADLHGFQLTMVNYLAVRQAIEALKLAQPDAHVVVGGPFLAPVSGQVLANEPLIDSVVPGEGEWTLLELLEHLKRGDKDYASINGLIWRDGAGRIRSNPPRRLVEDLDQLPFPARDFFEEIPRDPRDNGLTECVRVISSRGCVGDCSFCAVNMIAKMLKGKRWRGRSPMHVVDELEMLYTNHGARIFNFSDSSFEDPGALGKKRARAICEEIIRRNLPLSLKVYMRCETMKEEADLELLRLYKKAGVDVIIIGAEAGSDYELDLYNKRACLADNYRTALMLRDLDLFYVLVGFIMFGPYSTTETLSSNIDFLHSCGLTDNLMQLANMLIIVRGSKIYDRMQAEGRLVDSGNLWEQPRYTIADPVGERAAMYWQNLYSRFPATRVVTSLQVNTANIVTRMTNPANREILAAMGDEFAALKHGLARLNSEVGDTNAAHFRDVLDKIKHGASDDTLQDMAREHFSNYYGSLEPRYAELSDAFLSKVVDRKFGLSCLVFKHFFSAVAVNGTERIAGREDIVDAPGEPAAAAQ